MQRKLNEGIVVIFFLSYIREVENAAKKGHTAEALYGITTAVSRSTINNIRTKKSNPCLGREIQKRLHGGK